MHLQMQIAPGPARPRKASAVPRCGLPSAQQALHFTTADRQRVVTAYTPSFGSLLLLGGALTEYLSWRWTLYINLVFAGAAFIGGAVRRWATRRS
jgi:MFS family permease